MFNQSGNDDSYSQISIRQPTLFTRLAPKVSNQPTGGKWEGSIGQHCWTYRGLNFWEAIGTAREQSHGLELEIKSLLESFNESDDSFRNRTCPTLIMYRVYMVGLNLERANPTLIVSCENKKVRKMITTMIQASKILEKYPGFRLGESTNDPRYPRSKMPKRKAPSPTANYPSSTFDDVRVFVKGQDRQVACGTAIYIQQQDPKKFRKATIGGFLHMVTKENSHITVGVTVAHAFDDFLVEDAVFDEMDESESDVEFEFVGDTPEDYWHGVQDGNGFRKANEVHYHQFGSPCEIEFTDRDISAASSPSLASPLITLDDSEIFDIGFLYAKSTTKSNENYDWAVIQITGDDLTISNAIMTRQKHTYPQKDFLTQEDFSEETNSIKVVTCTGSRGADEGEMWGTKTYLKAEGSNTFGEVLIVELRGTLANGDSGSWIVEKITGKICGHIIAGDADSGITYIIPAKQVFDDIELQLQCYTEVVEEFQIHRKEITEGGRPAASSEIMDIDPLITLERRQEPHAGANIGLKRQSSASPLIGGRKRRRESTRSRDVEAPNRPTPSNFQQSAVNLQDSTSTEESLRPADANTQQTVPPATRNMPSPSNIVTGQNRERSRERDEERRQQEPLRTNEYFLPGEGIDREVITADICRYLGGDARVRPGIYEGPLIRGSPCQGYFITAYRNLTTSMIEDLKYDSQLWQAERRATALRSGLETYFSSQSSASIGNSTTAGQLDRQYNGPQQPTPDTTPSFRSAASSSTAMTGYAATADNRYRHNYATPDLTPTYPSTTIGAYQSVHDDRSLYQPQAQRYGQPATGYASAGGYDVQDNYYVAGAAYSPEDRSDRVSVQQGTVPTGTVQYSSTPTSQQPASSNPFYTSIRAATNTTLPMPSQYSPETSQAQQYNPTGSTQAPSNAGYPYNLSETAPPDSAYGSMNPSMTYTQIPDDILHESQRQASRAEQARAEHLREQERQRQRKEEREREPQAHRRQRR